MTVALTAIAAQAGLAHEGPTQVVSWPPSRREAHSALSLVEEEREVYYVEQTCGLASMIC